MKKNKSHSSSLHCDEVIIKDGVFLPEQLEVKHCPASIIFINEDATSCEVFCPHAAAATAAVSFILPAAGGRKPFYFHRTGRYLLQTSSSAQLVVTIGKEAEEIENSPRTNIPFSPLERDDYAPIPSSSQVLMQQQLNEEQEENKELFNSVLQFQRQSCDSAAMPNESSDSDDDVVLQRMRHRIKSAATVESTATSSTPPRNEQPEEVTTPSGSAARRGAKLAHALSSPISSASSCSSGKIERGVLNTQETMSDADVHALIAKEDVVIVLLQDYEFNVKAVHIRSDGLQSVEFRLSDDTPWHAEHELVGTYIPSSFSSTSFSSIKPGSKCFESPLLQKEECSAFVFCPQHAGEVKVQCQVYPDMVCMIYVHNIPASFRSMHQQQRIDLSQETSCISTGSLFRRKQRITTLPAESALAQPGPLQLDAEHIGEDDAVSDVAKAVSDVTSPPSVVEEVQHPFSPLSGIGTRIFAPKSHSALGSCSSGGEWSESQSSGVYDSDDMISDSDAIFNAPNYIRRRKPLELVKAFPNMSARDAINSGTVVGRKLRAATNQQIPLQKQQRSIFPGPTVDCDGDDEGEGYDSDHGDSKPVRVVLDGYSFRPRELTVHCGQQVLFRRYGNGPAVCLVCDGEFDHSTQQQQNSVTSHGDVSFVYRFETPGVYEVKNEIYSFMKCDVVVTGEQSAAGPGVSKKNKNFSARRGGGGSPPKLQGSFSLSSSGAVPAQQRPLSVTTTVTTTVDSLRTVSSVATTSSPSNITTTSIVNSSATAAPQQSSVEEANTLFGNFLKVPSTQCATTPGAIESDPTRQEETQPKTAVQRRRAREKQKYRMKLKDRERVEANAAAAADVSSEITGLTVNGNEPKCDDSAMSGTTTYATISLSNSNPASRGPASEAGSPALTNSARMKSTTYAAIDWSEDFDDDDDTVMEEEAVARDDSHIAEAEQIDVCDTCDCPNDAIYEKVVFNIEPANTAWVEKEHNQQHSDAKGSGQPESSSVTDQVESPSTNSVRDETLDDATSLNESTNMKCVEEQEEQHLPAAEESTQLMPGNHQPLKKKKSKKIRKGDVPIDERLQTPPAKCSRVEEVSSRASSSHPKSKLDLLRSTLRINGSSSSSCTPNALFHTPRQTSSAFLYTTPVENTAANLTHSVESFLRKRYDDILALYDAGLNDVLPSGKEVPIHYIKASDVHMNDYGRKKRNFRQQRSHKKKEDNISMNS